MYLTPIAEFWNAEGRINRLQYVVVLLCVWVTIFTMAAIVQDPKGFQVIFIIGELLLIPTCIKRFHDMNRSGFHVILSLIPLISVIYALLLLFTPGTKGPNKYGIAPDAKYKKGV